MQTVALRTWDRRVDHLARDVARVPGENITQAVIHAIEERLMRLKGHRTQPGQFRIDILLPCRTYASIRLSSAPHPPQEMKAETERLELHENYRSHVNSRSTESFSNSSSGQEG